MKIKTVVALALGAGAGYVLGTKAGRGKFEELKARANDLAHDPRLRSGAANVAEKVGEQAHRLPDPVAGAVRNAADSVQSAAEDSTESTGTSGTGTSPTSGTSGTGTSPTGGTSGTGTSPTS